MVVLDTSFLIDLDQREPRALALLQRLRDDDEPLVVPAQAAAEYLVFFENPLTEFAQLRAAFDVAVTGPDEILETARLARLASERGLRPRWADLSIGAVAMLHATSVLTSNVRHFRAVDVPAWDHRESGGETPR